MKEHLLTVVRAAAVSTPPLSLGAPPRACGRDAPLTLLGGADIRASLRQAQRSPAAAFDRHLAQGHSPGSQAGPAKRRH